MRLTALIARACFWIADHRPRRTFVGTQGDPYLSKFKLIGDFRASPYLALHFFHRGDEDRELHNHPWPGVSLILTGGYREEYLDAQGNVASRVLRPGNLNVIGLHTFHRVELIPGADPTWTLFLAGPKRQSWGFLDPRTLRFTPWRDFIIAKGLATTA